MAAPIPTAEARRLFSSSGWLSGARSDIAGRVMRVAGLPPRRRTIRLSQLP
jgi:hypothetical protein